MAVPGRTVRLYRRNLGAHVRATLEYEADFWIMLVAGALAPALSIAFLGAIFSQIPRLNGWTFAEVVCVYGLMSVADGFGAIVADGAWRIGAMINHGDLDYLIMRPYPVSLQVLSTAVGFNGIGTLLIGVIMLGYGLASAHLVWSPQSIVVGIVLVVSGVVVKISISLASNAASFWISGPNALVSLAVYSIGDLARYPITVYAVFLQVMLATVLPFAFVSFFPVSWILGHGELRWIGLLTPLVAIACALLAGWIFRRGLRRYESTGS